MWSRLQRMVVRLTVYQNQCCMSSNRMRGINYQPSFRRISHSAFGLWLHGGDWVIAHTHTSPRRSPTGHTHTTAQATAYTYTEHPTAASRLSRDTETDSETRAALLSLGLALQASAVHSYFILMRMTLPAALAASWSASSAILVTLLSWIL